MTDLRPWAAGDHESRWNGYFIEPDTEVLRNLLGVNDTQILADAENDLVEYRITELREQPGLVQRTFDLTHLQAFRHSFFVGEEPVRRSNRVHRVFLKSCSNQHSREFGSIEDP